MTYRPEPPAHALTNPESFVAWAVYSNTWMPLMGLDVPLVVCPLCGALVPYDWNTQQMHAEDHAVPYFLPPGPI